MFDLLQSILLKLCSRTHILETLYKNYNRIMHLFSHVRSWLHRHLKLLTACKTNTSTVILPYFQTVLHI